MNFVLGHWPPGGISPFFRSETRLVHLAIQGLVFMPACLIAGDSIAVGVAPFLPTCAVNAKIGISSTAIVSRAGAANVLIISAGSNDPRNPRLIENLKVIRAKATGRVIWIQPIDPVAAAAVRGVAAIHGDHIVTFSPAPDRVHPASDKRLADRVRAVM